MLDQKIPAYVAFQGGGALGMAHLGAWLVLSRFFQIKGTAGTSAGAIVAALCAANYDPPHAIDIFSELNWSSYVKPMTVKEWIDLVSKREGWTSGELFYRKMRELLAKRFISKPQRVSFRTLYDETEIYLAIIACDLNNNTATPVLFDIQHSPDVEVAFAIRASISIPGIFVPVPRRELGQILVDGGLLLNLPIEPLLPLAQKDNAVLIGVSFTRSNLYLDQPNALDTLKRSLGVALTPGTLPPPEVRQDPNYIDVVIDVTDFNSLDFNLSAQQKEDLLHRGADAASKALLNYEISKERLQMRGALSISITKSQERTARSIYISRSWRRSDEAVLVNYVCQTLYKAGFNPIGDAEDQAIYNLDRIKFIMSSCGGIVAFLSDRGQGSASKYIIGEIQMAQALSLPCFVIAESTVQLEEDITKSVVYVPIESFKSYTSHLPSLKRGLEDFVEESKAPPQLPHIFFATSFNGSHSLINQKIAQLVQNITAMPCIIGDAIKENQFVQQIISNQISGAQMVIADLSGDSSTSWNINTCIEAGIARGTNRELRLICKGPRRKPPFMFFDRQIHFYNSDEDLLGLIHELVYDYRRWIFKPSSSID